MAGKLLIVALLLMQAGCATGKKAHHDIKTYLKQVDDNYDCIGVEVGQEAAICIDDISISVTITF